MSIILFYSTSFLYFFYSIINLEKIIFTIQRLNSLMNICLQRTKFSTLLMKQKLVNKTTSKNNAKESFYQALNIFFWHTGLEIWTRNEKKSKSILWNKSTDSVPISKKTGEMARLRIIFSILEWWNWTKVDNLVHLNSKL